MLLNAVIIILREVLEASLLISVLLTLGHALQLRFYWLGLAILAGIAGAFAYQYYLEPISSAFDYAGQEIANAILQIGVYLALAVIVFCLNSRRSPQQLKHLALCMGIAVSLAITREGSEIILYMASFLHQPEHLSSVCIGGAIGASIGTSLSALVYYGLLSMNKRLLLVTGQVLLALVAASMLSQSMQLLIQADWLPAYQALWDSSALLSEDSVPGQLLYAIAGYEATPAPLQFLAYLFGLGSILFLLSGKAFRPRNRHHE